MYISNAKIIYYKISNFLNKEIFTESFGSFDRYWWGWKKKDFQDSTLAYSLLALLHLRQTDSKTQDNIFSGEELSFFIESGIRNIIHMQKNNGSFDQTYPNENHPKIGLDFSEAIYIYLKENKNPEAEKCYRRLIEYSLGAEEDYGAISNHLAHHTYEYLCAWDYFKEPAYYAKAQENLKIISENTSSEGWHREYFTCDAGYQTRTLKYLTKALSFFDGEDREKCLELCICSAEFLDKLILPDGTLYSMFGCRNTAVLYPSGIERIADMLPEKFSGMAARVRSSFQNGNAITPDMLEYDNLIRLFTDSLEANQYIGNNHADQPLTGEFIMPECGFVKKNINCTAVYLNYKMGGAIAVYKDNICIYKDAGILAKCSNGKWYGSRNILKHSSTDQENCETIYSEFFEHSHMEVTPGKFLLLRTLNLTLLRIRPFAELFRKFMVRTMIRGNEKSPISLIRKIEFKGDSIAVCDKIESDLKIEEIYRAPYLYLFHMASSRYTDPSYHGFQFKNIKESFENSGSHTQTIRL